MNTVVRLTVFLALGLHVWTPPRVAAQAPITPPSFETLRGLVAPGDDVLVTRVDGPRIRGRVVDVTPSSVTIAPNGRRGQAATLSVADVARLDRADRLVNGALIGAAASLLLIPQACEYTPGDDDDCGRAAAALMMPIGALFGALVDAAVTRRLYMAPPPPGTIRLGAAWTGSRRLRMNVTWAW